MDENLLFTVKPFDLTRVGNRPEKAQGNCGKVK